MTSLIGRQFGNYRLISKLGEGGYSTVYLGQHIRLPEGLVAVKVITSSRGWGYQEKFLKEAWILSQLVHPNIVRILDYGIQEGLYLIMEYASQGALRPRTVLSLKVIAVYLEQIGFALQLAHDRGITHCDLKPGNILLDENNTIRVSDFGVSDFGEVKSESLDYSERVSFSGTLPYCAPEQIQGKSVLASDQYSLGVMLYEWLTGTIPLPQLLNHSRVNPEVPSCTHYPAIESVVMRALSKEPKDRFSSIAELVSAFNQALLTQPRTECGESHIGDWQVAWSPDGKYIASGYHDGTIRIWEVATGNLDKSITTNQVARHENGMCIISEYGGGDTLRTWDGAIGAITK